MCWILCILKGNVFKKRINFDVAEWKWFNMVWLFSITYIKNASSTVVYGIPVCVFVENPENSICMLNKLQFALQSSVNSVTMCGSTE
jgi:hypothetical protein